MATQTLTEYLLFNSRTFFHSSHVSSLLLFLFLATLTHTLSCDCVPSSLHHNKNSRSPSLLFSHERRTNTTEQHATTFLHHSLAHYDLLFHAGRCKRSKGFGQDD